MIILRHSKFDKMLEKAPYKIRDKFQERLDLFLINPFDQILNNHSVDPLHPGCRSINITGNWRALFKSLGNNAVIFTKIGTHSQLYKK